MKVMKSVEDVLGLVGQELGVGQWKTVDQDRINAFAEVTEDKQWIHVDVDRAKTESPHGVTIAHGFLTLSFIPALSADNYGFENRKMGLNYGVNKVRFLAPVPVGSRLRARSELIDANRISESTVNLTIRHTVELEGSEKPAAIAELVTRAIW